MTTNDIDAIEARAKEIAKREQDEFPEIDVENSTLHISVQYHELIALCAEVRELRADCAAFCGQNERLIKAAGAENLDGAIAAIEAQRAALERARALLAELAACGYECQAGALENNQAYRELAALLAAASGGAA